jgi:hypothetical protein
VDSCTSIKTSNLHATRSSSKEMKKQTAMIQIYLTYLYFSKNIINLQ